MKASPWVTALIVTALLLAGAAATALPRPTGNTPVSPTPSTLPTGDAPTPAATGEPGYVGDFGYEPLPETISAEELRRHRTRFETPR